MVSALTRPLRAARMLDLVREIDLGAIKREAETRFSLELGGDPALAAQLAAALSATPGRSGVHPYVSVQARGIRSALPPNLRAPDLHVPDLRIVVQQGFGGSEPLSVVPTLVVCVADETSRNVGAELARPGEAARVVVTELTADLERTLVPEILRALPRHLHLALGRQLPVFRPAVIRNLIEETSRTNAVYAASTGVAEVVPVLNVPLNVADTVVLGKNQLVMAYKVALAAGKTGKPQELMGEIVGVLGGGLLFRQVARGLVGLIPIWGWLPKVAVAYAGTQVIGTATALWATEGRTVTARDLRGLYENALGRGRTLAGQLLRRNRNMEALSEGDETPQLEPPKDDLQG